MEDLPEELAIDILSRLPVKTILHCKRVCKNWQNLVLDSCFINLHLSRSPTALIIHHKLNTNMGEDEKDDVLDPGILKWVEIEDKVDHHHLHHHHPTMSLDLNLVLAPVLQNSLIEQMGSVNGLICLLQYYPKLDNTYICNPVTREIMTLPRHRYHIIQGFTTMLYGFGVNSLTGEYKVIRTFRGEITLNGYKSFVSEAEVYTLGTGQWRSLGRVPYRISGFCVFYATFLNDHCHWIVCIEEDAHENICTFDFNKETFQLLPSPPSEAIGESHVYFQGLVVLKGCLCKYYAYDSQFTMWVMKEYGVKKSWHKEVVIKQVISRDIEWPLTESIRLINGLKDGSILLVSEDKLCAFYPTSAKIEDAKMFDPELTGLAYRPSFLKLRNFESEMVQIF